MESCNGKNKQIVNNCFAVGLMVWKANIDTQQIFNHYKAAAYLCVYLSN